MASNVTGNESTGIKLEEKESQPQTDDVRSKASESTLSLPSTTSAATEDFDHDVRILQWVNYVDNQIDRTSLYILKLGLYQEIPPRNMENLDRPSSLFYALKSLHGERKALPRFLYALKKLGSKRHGTRCVNKFRTTVSAPPEVTDEQMEGQWLYQCLMDMCIDLDGQRDISRRLRNYASRHVLGVNWRHIDHTAHLFEWLLHDGHISKEDQNRLAFILDAAGAKSCIVILQHYRVNNGLDEIDIEHIQQEPQLSEATSATTLSSGDIQRPSHRGYGSIETGLTDSPRSTPSIPSGVDRHDVNERTQLIQDPHESDHHNPVLAHPPVPPVQQHVQDQPQHQFPPWLNFPWRHCVCSSSFLVICLFLLGAGLTLISLKAKNASIPEHTVALYENTTAALVDFETFSVSRAMLYQDPRFGETTHLISFFWGEESCHNLQYEKENSTRVNVSLPLPSRMLNNYLLEGSELNYSVCAVTNKSNGESSLVTFYILDNLDDVESFNPEMSKYVHRTDIKLIYSSTLTQPQNCFQHIELKVTTGSYYSIVILPPPSTEIPTTDIKAWYSTLNQLKMINTDLLKKVCEENVYTEKKKCNISLNSAPHLLKHQCLVAEVQHPHALVEDDNAHFTHVVITFTEWKAGKIVFYVLGGLTIGVALVFLALAVAVLIYLWCSRRN